MPAKLSIKYENRIKLFSQGRSMFQQYKKVNQERERHGILNKTDAKGIGDVRKFIRAEKSTDVPLLHIIMKDLANIEIKGKIK